MPTVHVNSFVKRQTPDSPFSHFEGTWDMLAELTELYFDPEHTTKGYREGVVLVRVPPERFFSTTRVLKEGDTWTMTYAPRVPGEAPRQRVLADGRQKMPAKMVDIVLYSAAVLAEDGSNEIPADSGGWEIISINASPFEPGEPVPMPTGTLMANHFHVEGSNDGGTSTGMSDSEFIAALRKSYEFWRNKLVVG